MINTCRDETGDAGCDGAEAPAALRWLEEHGDALYAYAVSRVRDPHTAEDLVQETLLAALAAVSRFEGRSAERSWLIGILKHKLLDHLRHNLREQPLNQVGADWSDEMFDRRGHWKTSPARWHAADPHALAENAEFRDVLAQCLSRLPSRMAQLFWLREAEDMQTAELCERLDLTAANVWAIMHRARTGLQKCLTLHWFDGGPHK
jgi:RNA polymerase sigma-70 factor (TIGR02943 family)